MNSHISVRQCLIVEDDKYKLDSIRSFLEQTWPGTWNIKESRALASAVRALGETSFDLVIIDMSIPSHEPEAGAGSPLPLPDGGLDVIFEVCHLSHSTCCIVLTQYPDISIEGHPVPVEQAAEEIRTRFGISVGACLKYSEHEEQWKMQLIKALEAA